MVPREDGGGRGVAQKQPVGPTPIRTSRIDGLGEYPEPSEDALHPGRYLARLGKPCHGARRACTGD